MQLFPPHSYLSHKGREDDKAGNMFQIKGVLTDLNTDTVIIYTDGAARGNPGPAAIGVIIQDQAGNSLARISRRLAATTNNQAEYRAVIIALEKAISLGARNVMLKSDSELVVNQINGKYKIRNTALRPLYQKIVQLAGTLESFKVSYIPRARNAEADALANQALDRH
jgi:ribonuclease HI